MTNSSNLMKLLIENKVNKVFDENKHKTPKMSSCIPGAFLNKIEVCCSTLVLLFTFFCFIQTSRPFQKRQLEAWRIECELGVISDPACPVHGGWGAWDAWSPCRGLCGDEGHRRRARRCDNPPPSADGLPCSGADEEVETCFLTNCTLDHFSIVVEGDIVRWQALRRLETVPALAERCLQKECSYESIEAALASDNTWQIDPEAFWNSLQCVKRNLGCPTVGEWGDWGDWSACSARCGRGKRWRIRRCDTPPPSSALATCAGSPLQASDCEGDQCTQAPDGGTWSEWGAWTPCSERCGAGVRWRRRACREVSVTRSPVRWGTHCVGPYDEFEICASTVCNLDGGWSGWGSWGPCSQTCGTGKRYRSRSCTRPTPAGTGHNCVGSKTEFGACYLNPCDAFTHVVVVFNGDSYLNYDFRKRRSSLFHFYIRFLPLSPHGTLVRRGAAGDPLVRLSVHQWHVCVDARGSSASSCVAPRACWPAPLEPARWHSALLAVSNEAATLRLDDAPDPVKASFPCDPDLPNAMMNIFVGERFHGEIQAMALNFMPLQISSHREQRSNQNDFTPTSSANVAYEKASIDEAYLPLHDDQYLRIPCFDAQDEWRLELTIKPEKDSGTVLFLMDDVKDSWLHMELLNKRLKMKLAVGDFHTESSSTAEYPSNQWLDLTLAMKKETNTIEASLNSGERLHVVVADEAARNQREVQKKRLVLLLREKAFMNAKDSVDCPRQLKPLSLTLCNDDFFVGGTPSEVGRKVSGDLTAFSGIIASISINNEMQDLHSFNVERNRRDKIQLSSRSASVSGSYQETAWGPSRRLSLTCLHGRQRSAQAPHHALWLLLDTSIADAVKQKTVRATDDGRVLKLVASADNDLRGFYTCRAHTNKRTVNVVTYGVTGKVKYNLSQPDPTTAIAVLTTVLLVLATLGWLVIEGIYDLRTGFGFFRDAHLSPEQEAEAVCAYIDEHAHEFETDSAVRLAKARARRRAKRTALDGRASFAAQEPEGLMAIHNETIEHVTSVDAEESMLSDLELPDIPDVKSATMSPRSGRCSVAVDKRALYRCQPSFVSSPRRGSASSPRGRLSSTSSPEQAPASPRFLCNRLQHTSRHSRHSLWGRRQRSGTFNRHFDSHHQLLSDLPTIKSSTFETQTRTPCSPALVLQKFQNLRCDD
ncbi:hypothetical protein O0L34_g2413 [Tuta absoluta]|nr:hypothetical protein O0L34_g2413 [Tuta absoluta]